MMVSGTPPESGEPALGGAAEGPPRLPPRLNFRDLGGRPAHGGREIARGRLYRSADPAALSPLDARRLAEEYGIGRVVDLRTNDELAALGEGRLTESCERHHLPLFDTIHPHWSRPTDRLPPSTAARYFEMLEEGRDILLGIVTMLATPPPVPTLLHCVAGRDRTGIVVACILDVLGVPESVILDDYAASAVRDDEHGRNAHPDNIRLLLGHVRERYGSTRRMLVASGAEPWLFDALADALLTE